jgi:hypothetical protein
MSNLSTLDDLVLRDTANPPLIDKQAELTYAEWDGNLVKIYNVVQDIVSGNSVTVYNPLTVYDSASADVYLKYSGYDGRIWEAIFVGAFSSETPEEGIYWTQITMAQLFPDLLRLAQISAGLGGGNTLDQAYDTGGAGVGRTIIADAGAVKIDGTDGLLVTGVIGAGATSEWVGGGAYDVGTFFNPKKGAFRAGVAQGTEWDDANVGSGSIAMGFNNTASGDGATAMGANNVASGENSTAMGDGTTASGDVATAMGFDTIASGVKSTAMGDSTTALSFVETVIGFWNTVYVPVSAVAWDAADRLFGIGNGTSVGNESDAFLVLKSGKITCPSITGSFTPNVLTTTQRDALTATRGMFIYNSTTDKGQMYDGTIWNDLF